jgi:hypothetical protein
MPDGGCVAVWHTRHKAEAVFGHLSDWKIGLLNLRLEDGATLLTCGDRGGPGWDRTSDLPRVKRVFDLR